MARIHARVKGKSGSKKPVNVDLSFVEIKAKDLEKMIIDFAKQDYTLSKIGLVLKDSYAIPSVKKITGKSISAIVNENNLLKTIPEDLNALVNKAKNLKKHLEFNKRDIHNRRGLLLIESKIRRLSKYYKKKEVLPKNWSY